MTPLTLLSYFTKKMCSIREQTVVFAENFPASTATRSVNENYIKFRTYLEEVMENKIPRN